MERVHRSDGMEPALDATLLPMERPARYRGAEKAGGDSGQALVESALTLPLLMFLILGMLQLFLMGQARLMAHYAAFRATRAGSVNHGYCAPMLDAAIASLMPTITRTDSVSKLASAFRTRRQNKYKMNADNANGDIVWLFREHPLAGEMAGDEWFDQGRLERLEVRLIYWYHLKIPFANWVMTRMYRAHFGLMAYTAANPLLEQQKANWTTGSGRALLDMDAQIKTEWDLRTQGNDQFIFPIEASYTMRMMTPANDSTPLCK